MELGGYFKRALQEARHRRQSIANAPTKVPVHAQVAFKKFHWDALQNDVTNFVKTLFRKAISIQEVAWLTTERPEERMCIVTCITHALS